MTALAFSTSTASTRRELLELLCSPEFERTLEQSRADHRADVRRWLKILGEKGYGALGFAKEYGGAGNQPAALATFETLAYHDISLCIKYGVQFGLFAGSIDNLGSPEQKAKYLRDAGHAHLPGCFAMTETGHGSNVAGLCVTATYDPDTDELIVNTPGRHAYKDYIGSAAEDAQMASVFAQLHVGDENHGVACVLVPIRDQDGNLLDGVHAEDDGAKAGLNGIDNGRLAFDNVRVPRTNLLSRFGDITEDGEYTSPIENPNKRFFTMLGTLVGGRVSVAAAALSAAKSALTIAVRYSDSRKQFGPPDGEEISLLDYLTHQRRLFPRIARTYALRAALDHLAYRFSTDDPEDHPARREVELLAAALKPQSTWHTLNTIQECREACGGQGYLTENRFADLRNDIDIFTTFEGDNTILLQLVGKERLKAFQQEVKAGGARALAAIAAEEVEQWIKRRNPIARRDESIYTDPDAMGEAFDYREARALLNLANGFNSDRRKKVPALESVISHQCDLVHYARAYAERLIFCTFRESLGDDPDEGLEKLLHLYALERLENDRGWWVEHLYFSTGVSAGLRSEVNRVCKSLRPHAVDLVNAWGIPDQLLMAPIATLPFARNERILGGSRGTSGEGVPACSKAKSTQTLPVA